MTAGRIAVLLLVGIGLGAGNAALVQTGQPLAEPRWLAALVAGPVVVALLAALIAPRAAAPAPAAEPTPLPPPPPPADPPETSALRLLAALQEDGRLIDFLTEEVAPYSDEQIGAATRGIHESLKKALDGCVRLEPVMQGAEGDPVTIAAGFDPTAVRLVGNVSGQPPFKGVLRHAGWRVTTIDVPERRGQDDRVLAPAEVEIA